MPARKHPRKTVSHMDADSIVRAAKKQASSHAAYWRKHAPVLHKKIVDALMADGYLSEAAADEAAFHMTDWVADLADLNRLFAKKTWDPVTANEVLNDFVVHAPNHLAAAYRILLGRPLTDVFELGAVKGSGRAKRKPGGPYRERKGTRRKA